MRPRLTDVFWPVACAKQPFIAMFASVTGMEAASAIMLDNYNHFSDPRCFGLVDPFSVPEQITTPIFPDGSRACG